MAGTAEWDPAYRGPGDFPAEEPGRIDKARLLEDQGYLLAVVCQQFQQVDTYHRGLITAAAFSRALEAVGLRYGQREVEDILQYCTITDDGYVHYKELLRVVGPLTPRAKQSTAKGAIFPPPQEESRQAWTRPVGVTPTAPRSRTPAAPSTAVVGRADEVRRLYARWERGQLSNADFKVELAEMGIPPTDELDHLLVVYGPSRGMPFRKLMNALQVDENDGRRARNAHGGCHGDSPAAAVAFARDCPAAGAEGEGYNRAPPAAWGADQGGSAASMDASVAGSLRQAICDFVDGQIPAVTFRQQLRRCGASMTTTLDRLIRTHECDNSVRFQDLARLLLLQDKREQNGEGAATPSCPRSSGGSAAETPGGPGPPGAQTPSSSRGGAGSRARGAGWGPGSGGSGGSGCAAQPGPGGGSGARTPSDLHYGTPPDLYGGYGGRGLDRGPRSDDGRAALSQSQSGRSAASGAWRGEPAPAAWWGEAAPASWRGEPSPGLGQQGPRWQHGGGPGGPFDDARSLTSHGQASYSSSAPAHDDGYYAQPPYATVQDLAGGTPLRRPPRPASATRAGGHSGDIIGWKDRPEQEPQPPRPRHNGAAAADLLCWPSDDRRREEDPVRLGKRFYGRTAPACDAAPYGRSSDIGPPGQRQSPVAAPFGTDQDLGLQRPEDAGTDEYRAAVRYARRA